MILSGFRDMSFLLEPTSRHASNVHLQPRITPNVVVGIDYDAGARIGLPCPWTITQVGAAASWWRAVAEGRELMDERHVWFGGGVCFGRVAPKFGADFGIDILVLDDPDGVRPPIDYNRGVVEVGDSAHTDFSYVTVDTTAEQVSAAATWWEALLQSVSR